MIEEEEKEKEKDGGRKVQFKTRTQPGRRLGKKRNGTSQHVEIPWVVILTAKRPPAARYIAATGLVKSWVAVFTENK